jgi:hypothetical protein
MFFATFYITHWPYYVHLLSRKDTRNKLTPFAESGVLCKISQRAAFNDAELPTTRQTTNQDHPLLAVREYLFNIFAATSRRAMMW